MIDRQYPATVVEFLDDQMSFSSALLQAVQAFSESKPWQGSSKSRQEKFRQLNRSMAEACRIELPKLVFGRLDGGSTGLSYYLRREHRIVLVGKLSVITFLHEFGHALGYGEREACRWSINLFRKCFPQQYSNLVTLQPRAMASALQM